MKLTWLCLFAFLIPLLHTDTALCDDIKVVKVLHEYQMKDTETKRDARRNCLLEAQRAAIEQVGILILSGFKIKSYESGSESSQIIEDNLETFSASITKTDILSEKWISQNNNITLRMEIKVYVNKDEFHNAVKRIETSPLPFNRAKYENKKQKIRNFGKYVLRHIKIGMTIDEVYALLGMPDREECNDHNIRQLKYRYDSEYERESKFNSWKDLMKNQKYCNFMYFHYMLRFKFNSLLSITMSLDLDCAYLGEYKPGDFGCFYTEHILIKSQNYNLLKDGITDEYLMWQHRSLTWETYSPSYRGYTSSEIEKIINNKKDMQINFDLVTEVIKASGLVPAEIEERKRVEAERKRIEAKKKKLLAMRVVKRDKRFEKYANGVVYDTKTGLEWYTGPDEDTDWDEARSWVDNLDVADGGWRMPTSRELRKLYQKGVGKVNLPPLFLNKGWITWPNEYFYVWTGKLPSYPLKHVLLYEFTDSGREVGTYISEYKSIRVFAVRSRR